MHKKLPKNWKEIQEQLMLDDKALSGAVGGHKSYKKTLDDICGQPADTTSIGKISSMFNELKGAFELPRKYDHYHSLDEISPGLTGRLNLIEKLEQQHYDSFLYLIGDISRQWNTAKKRFKHWKTEFGIDELRQERTRLNYVSDLYAQLKQGFGGDLCNHEIDELSRYNSFIKEVASADTELESINKRYSARKNLKLEKINVLMRDLSEIKEKYTASTKQNANLLEKIFPKKSIFVYTEGLFAVDTMLEELASARQNLETSGKTQATLEAPPTQKQEEPTPFLKPTPIQPLEQVCAQDTPYLPAEVISPSLATHSKPLPDTSLPEKAKPSPLFYHPITRNQGNRFNLPAHLLIIGYPSMRYMKLVDTLLGKTPISHPIDRLDSFKDQLAKLPTPQSVKDLDYFYHIEYALREDMNRGTIDPLICDNPQYWERAHGALEALGQYILRSEESLGLDEARIASHQPLTGQENQYNKMLC